MAATPVPGQSLPDREFLDNVARLVPCEALGACTALNSGPVLDETQVSHGYYDRYADEVAEHGGPLYVGTRSDAS